MKIYSSSRLKTIKLGAGEGKVIDKADSAVSKIDLSWLALAAPVYHISPNIDDYVIVNTIITISDLPNRNGIAFPLTELVGFDEPPYNRLAYEGWLKAPLFAEHCFTGETLISTPEGFKQISKIKVGDEVYTHNKRVRKVTQTFNNGKKDTYCVDALGMIYPFCATANHPLLVVDARQTKYNKDFACKLINSKVNKGLDPSETIAKCYGVSKSELNSVLVTGNVGTHMWSYLNEPTTKLKPHWRPVSDIYVGDYLVCPVLIGGNISVDPNFAFLLGLYTAEGSMHFHQKNKKIDLDSPSAVSLTLGFNEAKLMAKAVECCEALGYDYKKIYCQAKSTATLSIKNDNFAKACETLVGHYSSLKCMKGELRQWNKESITQFLAGYISGDGSITNGGRLRCITSSRDLAIDIQHALAFLGITASASGNEHWAGIYTQNQFNKHFRLKEFSSLKASSVNDKNAQETHAGKPRKNKGGKPSRYMEGGYCIGAANDELTSELRSSIVKNYDVYNRAPRYTVSGPRIILRDGYILFPISAIYKNPVKETVYNLEVEEDHSYLASSIVAHNCNEDCTKAKGVVLDVSLRKVEGYGQGRLWKVTGILAFDKTKDPELAEKIANGTINTYSMGATADHFTCSYCGEVCTEAHCCAHIKSIDTVNFSEVKDVDGNTHLAFLNAHGLSPIEVSAVEDPAWAPALSTNILFNKAPSYKVTLDKQDSKKSDDNDRPSANEIIEHLSRISFNNGY